MVCFPDMTGYLFCPKKEVNLEDTSIRLPVDKSNRWLCRIPMKQVETATGEANSKLIAALKHVVIYHLKWNDLPMVHPLVPLVPRFTAMFDCMGALSTKRNHEPTKVCPECRRLNSWFFTFTASQSPWLPHWFRMMLQWIDQHLSTPIIMNWSILHLLWLVIRCFLTFLYYKHL